MKHLYSLFIFAAILCAGSPQQVTAQRTKTTPMNPEVAKYEPQVREMISFFEFILNELGSKDVPSPDKQIIIRESYIKLFKNDKVQIEDDLDENREAVTNKDVQAYLKDVNFFFKDVRFTFTIDAIEPQTSELGELYFKVTLSRSLQGTTIENERINNVQPRYVEINVDKANETLKIASVYTTKLSEKEELIAWWNDMPAEWRTLLGKDVYLDQAITLESITDLTETSAAAFPGIFTQLKKLQSIEDLDLNGLDIADLSPLSRMTALRTLRISGTKVEDLTPIRNLTRLRLLECSRTMVKTLDPLLFCTTIQELYVSNTFLTDLSVVSNFTDLSILHAQFTGISTLSFLDGFTNLKDVRIDNTRVSDLTPLQGSSNLERFSGNNCPIVSADALKAMQNLKIIDFSGTRLSTLEPLGKLPKLEELYIDNCTGVRSLEPMKDAPSLKSIYCDKSGISKEEATRFSNLRPKVLVVFESEMLNKWWQELGPEWRQFLSRLNNLNGTPSKEQLHQLVSVPKLDLSGNRSIRSLDPLKVFSSLHVLLIDNTTLSDLAVVASLRDLRELSASSTQVASLAPLAQNTTLRKLQLSMTPVEDLTPLANVLSLEELHLDNTLVSNLGPLKGLPNLKLLYVDHVSNLNPQQVLNLYAANSNCLIVYRTPSLNEWWSSLSPAWKQAFRAETGGSDSPTREQLHQLTSILALTVPEGSNVGNLAPLTTFIRLSQLTVSNTGINTIEALAGLRTLQELDFSRNPVSNIAPLAGLTNLKKLSMQNTPVEDLRPLASLRALEDLNISGTQVKDLAPLQGLNLIILDCSLTQIRNLKPLFGHKRLQSLKCFNTRLNPKRVDEFKKEVPRCNVVFY